MKRAILAALFGIALALMWVGARSQNLPLLYGGVAATASYCGPGDTGGSCAGVSGALIGWSCSQAWTAAYASGGGAGCRFARTIDSHQCDFGLSSTTGKITTAQNCSTSGDNGSTLAAWAGTSATCTGGTASGTTTLTMTGCTGINVTGQTNPGDYLVSYTVASGSVVGQMWANATLGGGTSTQTFTLDTPQTVTLTGITIQNGLKIVVAYDQPGSGANNAIQSGSNESPFYIPGAVGGIGCAAFNGDFSATQYLYLATPSTAINQPYSMSGVGLRTTGATGSAGTFMIGTANNVQMDWTNGTANQLLAYAGSSNITVAATDGAAHSIQYIINGASSVIVADNSPGTTANAGSQNIGTGQVDWGGWGGVGNYLNGYLCSSWVYNATALTSTQYGKLRTIDKNLYGTP